MKRILIIEDDPYIAELQKDYFALHEFDVTLSFDGKDGLQRALHEQYDLVIVDLQLPNVDGFEICRRIRDELEVPILIVSAKKEELDKIRGFGLGADDFVTKPFSPNELVARAKAHMARYDRFKLGTKSIPSDTLHIRELSINQSSHRVYVHDKEVFLTAKEFEVLVFMAKHPNRVFSKDQLFEKIWGFDSNGDIATVTVHISRIREKIEADPANPQFIETVWGAGYRFTI
ncbi:response regulator transcription factor [Paenibacillus yanchengensis]|uniref:Response regulator transcription factor n=1 Tax=Paenibacillus yanchengensis TaxID=2035833 RepID=A0ABW4YHW8_9BACL